MTWKPLERSTPYRNGVPVDIQDEEQWSNDLYVVHKRVMHSEDPEQPDAIHLSIRNQDRSARHDWRDFQRIKNQLAGPDWTAVEIYPAEEDLVDMANQYHLWCYPFWPGIGWRGRRVANQAQADILSMGSVQRDPEEVDLQYGGLSKLKDLKRDIHAGGYGLPLDEEEGQ